LLSLLYISVLNLLFTVKSTLLTVCRQAGDAVLHVFAI